MPTESHDQEDKLDKLAVAAVPGVPPVQTFPEGSGSFSSSSVSSFLPSLSCAIPPHPSLRKVASIISPLRPSKANPSMVGQRASADVVFPD